MSKSIGFIGGGAMVTGIIKGILSANTLTAEEIYVKELLPERQVYLKETYGLQLADSLKELAEKAKVLVLAVRPQDAEKAARELSEVITQEHVLVSICAGIKIEKLSGWIGEKVTYARIMPNTMTEIKRGYSALTFSENASEEAKQSVQRITDSIGSTLVIPEKQFDAIYRIKLCRSGMASSLCSSFDGCRCRVRYFQSRCKKNCYSEPDRYRTSSGGYRQPSVPDYRRDEHAGRYRHCRISHFRKCRSQWDRDGCSTGCI